MTPFLQAPRATSAWFGHDTVAIDRDAFEQHMAGVAKRVRNEQVRRALAKAKARIRERDAEQKRSAG